MGSKCVSPHANENRQEHRHDLHFECFLKILENALTSAQVPKCPSCAVVLKNSDIAAFARKTLYRYGTPNREGKNTDPIDIRFHQSIFRFQNKEEVTPLVKEIIAYIQAKEPSEEKKPS